MAVPISMDGSQFHAVSQKLSPKSAMFGDLSGLFLSLFKSTIPNQGISNIRLLCSGNCKARFVPCKEGIRRVNDNNNWFISYYSAKLVTVEQGVQGDAVLLPGSGEPCPGDRQESLGGSHTSPASSSPRSPPQAACIGFLNSYWHEEVNKKEE